MTPSIIAIDGPVASGKTVIGKRLADQLGYLFFDTGIMYRAVTYLALRYLGSAHDQAAVAELAVRAHIDVRPATVNDGRDSTVSSARERSPSRNPASVILRCAHGDGRWRILSSSGHKKARRSGGLWDVTSFSSA